MNKVISTNRASTVNAATNLMEEVAAADASLVNDLEKHAAQGSSGAQYSLAMCYLNGDHGVKKDYETAKVLLDMSASQGNVEAKEEIEKLKKAFGNSDKNSGTK